VNRLIVGIDIGTQSLKATVLGTDLAVRAGASTGYEARYPQPGWAEQDPRSWENALAPTIAAALSRAGAEPSQVGAVGIAGQLDGCVAVDQRNEPLGPCLIWLDRRAALPDQAGLAEYIARRCGIVADPGHMAAKIAWLKHNGIGGAVRFHQPVSYLVSRLTGHAVMDHALASTTMLYDLDSRAWSADLLAAFGVLTEELPELAQASEAAGALNEAGARLTGLPAGIPVAVGTGDDFSTPLGAGIVRPGRLACVLGTAEVVGALDAEPKIDDHGLLETHAYVGGFHFIENPGWYAGGAVEWFIRCHRLDGTGEFNALAAQAPPGSDGVLFLPALSGAMAPEWNADARACFYGLTASHDISHMARAVLEGCAYAMRDVVDRLREMDVPLQAIRLLGGGARSPLWAQIRADVAQLPVELPGEVDTSPVGAALLAATAAGIAPDIVTAAEQRQDVKSILQPGDGAAYDAGHARYLALFEALKPVFRDYDETSA